MKTFNKITYEEAILQKKRLDFEKFIEVQLQKLLAKDKAVNDAAQAPTGDKGVTE